MEFSQLRESAKGSGGLRLAAWPHLAGQASLGRELEDGVKREAAQ